ncbi:radical SAM protein [Frankia sp. CiP3]|uniref:radical SAM protein n=1 Tax=Frankia sp. CiP3 TaxID=2880971 RepID=UPI0021066AE0|nr:radical SAM protein [Frankia sp. CiP3]
MVFLELTRDCNLHCAMCRSSSDSFRGMNMPRDILLEIAEELFPSAALVDLRGWGESTLLRDFGWNVEKALSYGTRLRLVTNALSLRPSDARLLFDGEAMVVVSVDAVSQEAASVLRRGSVRRLYSQLRMLADTRAAAGRGRLFFNTVLSAANVRELSEIVAVAGSAGAERMTLFPVVADRDNPLHLSQVPPDLLVRSLIEAAERARQAGLELRLGASLTEDLAPDVPGMTRCTHPWSVVYIDYRGGVGYCDHLIGHDSQIFAELSPDIGVLDIWNGPGFQALRRRHAAVRVSGTEGLLRHCAWCYVRRQTDFEDEVFEVEKARIAPLALALSRSAGRAGCGYEFHEFINVDSVRRRDGN